MSYLQADFLEDAIKAARSLHLAYRRAKFTVSRWNAEFSATIPNDATEVHPGITGAQIWLHITRCQELITDYEATSNAKLNTILAVSDLSLPGNV